MEQGVRATLIVALTDRAAEVSVSNCAMPLLQLVPTTASAEQAVLDSGRRGGNSFSRDAMHCGRSGISFVGFASGGGRPNGGKGAVVEKKDAHPGFEEDRLVHFAILTALPTPPTGCSCSRRSACRQTQCAVDENRSAFEGIEGGSKMKGPNISRSSFEGRPQSGRLAKRKHYSETLNAHTQRTNGQTAYGFKRIFTKQR